MVSVPVSCPNCGNEKVVRRGGGDDGKQRYLCRNEDCGTKSLMLNYAYNGVKLDVRESIIRMTLNGSGIRDIARVPGISTGTVMSELKKKEIFLEPVNIRLLESLEHIENTDVEIRKVEEAEADEMRSFVGKKGNRRWLWHAIDHKTGEVPAHTFGDHRDDVFSG